MQSDRGGRRTATGVGFGLAIVKLLAEVSHGTAGYRKGSPTGAVFTIELPGIENWARLVGCTTSALLDRYSVVLPARAGITRG